MELIAGTQRNSLDGRCGWVGRCVTCGGGDGSYSEPAQDAEEVETCKWMVKVAESALSCSMGVSLWKRRVTVGSGAWSRSGGLPSLVTAFLWGGIIVGVVMLDKSAR